MTPSARTKLLAWSRVCRRYAVLCITVWHRLWKLGITRDARPQCSPVSEEAFRDDRNTFCLQVWPCSDRDVRKASGSQKGGRIPWTPRSAADAAAPRGACCGGTLFRGFARFGETERSLTHGYPLSPLRGSQPQHAKMRVSRCNPGGGLSQHHPYAHAGPDGLARLCTWRSWASSQRSWITTASTDSRGDGEAGEH